MIKLQAPSQIITKDENLTVFREGCVEYLDGKPVKKNVTQFDIRCNIQPMGGRDLLLVPEGDRFRDPFWIWTTEDIKINDRVVRCGYNYQVQTTQQWGSFIQAMIMRIDVGVNATP